MKKQPMVLRRFTLQPTNDVVVYTFEVEHAQEKAIIESVSTDFHPDTGRLRPAQCGVITVRDRGSLAPHLDGTQWIQPKVHATKLVAVQEQSGETELTDFCGKYLGSFINGQGTRWHVFRYVEPPSTPDAPAAGAAPARPSADTVPAAPPSAPPASAGRTRTQNAPDAASRPQPSAASSSARTSTGTGDGARKPSFLPEGAPQQSAHGKPAR